MVVRLTSQNRRSVALKPAGDTEPERQRDTSSFQKGGVFQMLGAGHRSADTPVNTLYQDRAELTRTVRLLTAMTGLGSQG